MVRRPFFLNLPSHPDEPGSDLYAPVSPSFAEELASLVIKRKISSALFSIFIDPKSLNSGPQAQISISDKDIQTGCSCTSALQAFEAWIKGTPQTAFEHRIVCASQGGVREAVPFFKRILCLQPITDSECPETRLAFLKILLSLLSVFCVCGKVQKESLDWSSVFIPYLSWKRPRIFQVPDTVYSASANAELAYLISRRLPSGKKDAKPQQPGYIYILETPDVPGLLKIGCSEDDVGSRRKDWSHCYPAIRIVAKTNKVPFVTRVEGLIHAELLSKRRVQLCAKCHKSHKLPIEHKEWFEVSPSTAYEVVERWAKWMAKSPYDVKSRMLKPYWRKPLEEARRLGYTPATEPVNYGQPTWQSFTDSCSAKDKDCSGMVRLEEFPAEESPFDK